LRLISFVSFVGILFVFRALYNNVFLYLFFIIAVTTSNIMFNYIYIFRGYYVAALLATLTFYYLDKYFKENYKKKFLRILLILILIQFTHSLLTIYVAIPSLCIIILISIKEKIIKKNIFDFSFFFLLLISIYIFYSFLEGFVILHNSDLNFNFLFKNFFMIFIPCVITGFKSMFFSNYTPSDFFILQDVFRAMFYGADDILVSEPIFLIIYISAIFVAILNLSKLKSNYYLSITILIIFIFFISIFKAPPLRAHIGSVIFCLFYLINCISVLNLSNNKILNKISFIICFFLIINVTPNKDFQQTKQEILKIDKYKFDCIKAREKLNQYEVWVMINYYPNNCNYKYDSDLKKNILF